MQKRNNPANNASCCLSGSGLQATFPRQQIIAIVNGNLLISSPNPPCCSSAEPATLLLAAASRHLGSLRTPPVNDILAESPSLRRRSLRVPQKTNIIIRVFPSHGKDNKITGSCPREKHINELALFLSVLELFSSITSPTISIFPDHDLASMIC